MTASSFLNWPFFEARHHELHAGVEAWCMQNLNAAHGESRDSVDAYCIGLVKKLGAAGFLRHCVTSDHGGAAADFDVRSIALIRETLARFDGLADFAFAMQGLGSGAVTLAGTAALQAKYLPRVVRGEALAAFALSEEQAGSDVAGMQCSARRDGEHYVLDGTKTWIPLTQNDIATMTGVTRSTVNRLLRQAQAEGFVAVSRSSIEVVDEAALRRRAGLRPAAVRT